MFIGAFFWTVEMKEKRVTSFDIVVVIVFIVVISESESVRGGEYRDCNCNGYITLL